MGSPTIFSGRRTKALTADGLLLSNNSVIDNDGILEYIKNGHAEINTAGWATYADAAATSPVDGTGGSPTLTFTRTTTNVLGDSGSFLLTKPSLANAQGQGASYDFTIQNKDKAKVLQISFDYDVDSGTFTAGSSSSISDITVWVYDVTNAVLIQPSSINLLSNSTTIADKFSATFQTSATSTSYRLILHCTTTTTTAFALMIKNISVKPSQYTYGTPVTAWQNFPSVAAGTLITATTTNPTYGTVVTNYARWRRVGEDAEIEWNFAQSAVGTAGAGAYLFNLPAGLVLDDSYVVNTNISSGSTSIWSNNSVGRADLHYEAGAAKSYGYGNVVPYSATQLKMYIGFTAENGTTDSDVWGTFYGFNLAPLSISLKAKFKVKGWGASVQTSDQADTREVTASYSRSTTQSIPNATNTTMIYDTKLIDTHAAFNTSTGKFTVPSAGSYDMEASVFFTNFVGAAGNFLQMLFYRRNSAGTLLEGIYKDNFAYQAAVGLEASLTSSHIFNCNAGDTLEVIIFQSSGASRTTIAGINSVSFKKRQGPSAIAASEKIYARYNSSSSALSGTLGDIVYTTRDVDTHGAYNNTTGVFTCPRAGFLKTTASLAFTAVSAGQANLLELDLIKNGTAYAMQSFPNGSGIALNQRLISDGIPVLAGDQIKLQASAGTTTPSIFASATRNFISFELI